MLQSTEKLLQKVGGKVLTNADIKRVFKGTAASRYALVNKALKKKEIIQLKRGVYFLNPKYLTQRLSHFHVAGQMISHSYISLESALSYHGWIPERVTVVSSVIHLGRTKSFSNDLGEFHYHFIPVQPYEFLTGVTREKYDDQPFLIASGLRALMDSVYEKKLEWKGLDYLTDSFRIDLDHLMQLKKEDFNSMKQVYQSKRVLLFLNKLEEVLQKS